MGSNICDFIFFYNYLGGALLEKSSNQIAFSLSSLLFHCQIFIHLSGARFVDVASNQNSNTGSSNKVCDLGPEREYKSHYAYLPLLALVYSLTLQMVPSVLPDVVLKQRTSPKPQYCQLLPQPKK